MKTDSDKTFGGGLLGCTVGWTVIGQKLTSLNRLLHSLTPDLNQLNAPESGILATLLAVQPASNTARVGGTYARGAALKGGGRMAVVVFILKRTSCEKSGRPHDQKICPCCIVRQRHRMFRPVDSARNAKKVATPMFDRWRGNWYAELRDGHGGI